MTAFGSGTLDISTPSDLELRIVRRFRAPRALVFDAWITPEHITRWMLGPEGWTMPVCEVDARPGGSWRFVWRRASGTEMAMHGVYKEIVRPERLVSTESWGSDWPETLNTVELAEHDGITTMTLTILYPSRDARDAAARTGMSDGLTTSLDRLAELLDLQR